MLFFSIVFESSTFKLFVKNFVDESVNKMEVILWINSQQHYHLSELLIYLYTSMILTIQLVQEGKTSNTNYKYS